VRLVDICFWRGFGFNGGDLDCIMGVAKGSVGRGKAYSEGEYESACSAVEEIGE